MQRGGDRGRGRGGLERGRGFRGARGGPGPGGGRGRGGGGGGGFVPREQAGYIIFTFLQPKLMSCKHLCRGPTR